MKPSKFWLVLVVLYFSSPTVAQTIDPAYSANYSVIFQDNPPGVPAGSGGLAFKFDDPNTLLICGNAEGPSGAIYSIGITRDADGHINGFAGPATSFATASQCDGGLAYGRANDVLFYSRWPTNELGEIKVGSTMTDRVISLAPLGVEASHSALTFVPDAIALTAGNLKMVTWSGGQWNDATPSPDLAGTYDVDPVTQVPTSRLPNGPEGIIYVPTTSPQFEIQSILVSGWGPGSVDAYQVDERGDPIVLTQQHFMTLLQAEGSAQDPVSGDMLFGRFTNLPFVLVVKGFQLPPAPLSASTVAAPNAPMQQPQNKTQLLR
jgi:hypothetical protein